MTDLSEVKAGGPAIGTAMPRVEDARLLQGQGQYAADLRGENMLHAVIVRSAVAHGQLRALLYLDIIGQSALWVAVACALLSAADYFRRFSGVLNPRVSTFPIAQDRRSTDRKAG